MTNHTEPPRLENRGIRVDVDRWNEFDAFCKAIDSDRSKIARRLIDNWVAQQKLKQDGRAA